MLLSAALLGLWSHAADAQMRPLDEPPETSLDALISPAPSFGDTISSGPVSGSRTPTWQDSMMFGTIGGVEAEILRGPRFSAGLTARSERPGYRLNIGRDESTLEFGAFGALTFDDWSLIGRVGQDVSEDGGGFVADLGVRWASQISDRWSFAVGSGVSWGSGGYLDRFYGVSGRDSGGKGLRLYDPSPGLKDVTISGSVTYSLSESWTLGGLIGAQRLLGPAAASPLVKDENEFFGGLSLDYRF